MQKPETETTIQFLSRLRTLKVKVSVDGGQMKCSAPAGVLTGELKTELAKRKPEIVNFLSSVDKDGQSVAGAIQRIPREGDLPVSFGQARLWFLDQFEPGSTAYNISGALRLTGLLDSDSLERALRKIVERHETLRSSIVTVDGEPKTRILPPESWSLVEKHLDLDLSTDPEEALRNACLEEIRRPFKLAEGPLFRAVLVSLGPQDNIVVLSIHHIVSDGWSMPIIFRELATLYAAYAAGKDLQLPDLPIQYVDFAHWQRKWLEGNVLDGQLAYWKRKLSGSLPILELPTDRPRPALQTFRGTRTMKLFSPEISKSLSALARDQRATLFMVLLAAYKALLMRYSGIEDVIVGSASANRGRVELEGLVGLFATNLVLRTDLSGDPTLAALIQRIRQTVLEAHENQDVPFERLVDLVDVDRSLSHPPLFQCMLILHNFSQSGAALQGLRLGTVHLPSNTTRFDLTFEITDTPRGLLVVAEYNTDLFDSETIDQLLEHYERMLEALATDTTQTIWSVPLVSPDDDCRPRWNDSVRDYDRDATLPRALTEQAAKTPDAVALSFRDSELTYRELEGRSNQLAHHLRSVGVETGARVGICMHRSIDMIVGLLGIVKAGAAYIPLDPLFPPDRLRFMAEDADIAALLIDDGAGGPFAHINVPKLSPATAADAIDRQSTEAPDTGLTSDDAAYIIYTSGSTGKPKGVEIGHRSLMNFLASMQSQPGLGSCDRLLSVTTISFDIFGLELYLPLVSGARVVLASHEESFDGHRLMTLIEDSGATIMQATPATWRLLLASGWKRGSGLKLLCGGEALAADLAGQLLNTGAELWNLYGPTEATIWSTACRIRPGEDTITIGRPIANTQIYILDRFMRPTPVGVPGELFIGGEGLAKGYWRRPELTSERFLDDPFRQTPGARMYRTGDLARFRRDGTIEYFGRLDHQVKLRGYRIELGEIESVLAAHAGITQAVVIIREDTPGDPRLVAYLTPVSDAAPGPDDMRRHLRQHLPEYMVPGAYVTLESFPLTPNGKVDRLALPAPSGDRPELEAEFVSPESELEHAIALACRNVLQLEKVGVHDNFFDLGGNSLLIVQFQAKLEKTTGRRIPLVAFFQKPTVRALAEYLADSPSDHDSIGRVRARAERQQEALRLSGRQKHGI